MILRLNDTVLRDNPITIANLTKTNVDLLRDKIDDKSDKETVSFYSVSLPGTAFIAAPFATIYTLAKGNSPIVTPFGVISNGMAEMLLAYFGVASELSKAFLAGCLEAIIVALICFSFALAKQYVMTGEIHLFKKGGEENGQ